MFTDFALVWLGGFLLHGQFPCSVQAGLGISGCLAVLFRVGRVSSPGVALPSLGSHTFRNGPHREVICARLGTQPSWRASWVSPQLVLEREFQGMFALANFGLFNENANEIRAISTPRWFLHDFLACPYRPF